MIQRDHSAILSTFIKIPVVIKTFVLSILNVCFTQGLLHFKTVMFDFIEQWQVEVFNIYRFRHFGHMLF